MDKYLSMITSEHQLKPKFAAWLGTATGMLENVQSLLADWNSHFDIDTASGAQLDIIGAILGVPRTLSFQPRSTTGKNLLNPAAGTLTGVGSAAATQVINNGNFATDSNGDKVPDGFALNNASPVSLSGGEFTFRASAQYGSCSYGTALAPGRRYFIRADVLAYSPKVKLQVTKGSGQYLNAYHPGDGAYHTLDFVVDIPSGFASATVYVQDELASGWQNIGVKNFMSVDMGQSYYATTQAITNGNFATSSNNLATNFIASSATAISCTGNTQTFIATAQYGEIYYSGALLTDHRYFITANVMASTTGAHVQIHKNASTYVSSSYHPGDGKYHVLSAIADIDSGYSSANPMVRDDSASGWKNISVQNFMAIDMGTAASNPLYNQTASWMANEYPNYVEGSLAANPFYEMTADQMNTMVQKKGYWEGSSQLGGVDVTVAADGTITLDGTATAAKEFEISPNLLTSTPINANPLVSMVSGLNYTASVTTISGQVANNAEMYFKALDASGITYPGNFIFAMHFTSVSKTITAGTASASGYSTSLNIGIFSLQIPSGTVFSAYTFRLQLEQSSTATAWEPYTIIPVSAIMTDSVYHLALKAAIAKAHFDGTIPTLMSLLTSLFASEGLHFAIQDNQDMTFDVIVFGASSSIVQDLFAHGYIFPRPEGVSINLAFSTDKAFSWNLETDYFAGWNEGYWVI